MCDHVAVLALAAVYVNSLNSWRCYRKEPEILEQVSKLSCLSLFLSWSCWVKNNNNNKNVSPRCSVASHRHSNAVSCNTVGHRRHCCSNVASYSAPGHTRHRYSSIAGHCRSSAVAHRCQWCIVPVATLPITIAVTSRAAVLPTIATIAVEVLLAIVATTSQVATLPTIVVSVLQATVLPANAAIVTTTLRVAVLLTIAATTLLAIIATMAWAVTLLTIVAIAVTTLPTIAVVTPQATMLPAIAASCNVVSHCHHHCKL